MQTDYALFIGEEHGQAMSPRQRELLRMDYGIDQKNAADYYPGQMRPKRYD